MIEIVPEQTVDNQQDLCQAPRKYNTINNNGEENKLAEASKEVKLNLHKEAEDSLKVFSPKILEKPISRMNKNSTNH